MSSEARKAVIASLDKMDKELDETVSDVEFMPRGPIRDTFKSILPIFQDQQLILREIVHYVSTLEEEVEH